jgi:hypothetical protein
MSITQHAVALVTEASNWVDDVECKFFQISTGAPNVESVRFNFETYWNLVSAATSQVFNRDHVGAPACAIFLGDLPIGVV